MTAQREAELLLELRVFDLRCQIFNRRVACGIDVLRRTLFRLWRTA